MHDVYKKTKCKKNTANLFVPTQSEYPVLDPLRLPVRQEFSPFIVSTSILTLCLKFSHTTLRMRVSKDNFFQPSSRVEVEVTVTDSCSDLRKYYSSKSMSMLTLLTFLLLLLSISGVLYLPYQYFVNYYCQIRYIILYHDKTTCSNTWYNCISPRLHLYFCPLLIFVIVLAFVFENPLT